MPNLETELERACTISLQDSHQQKALLPLDGGQSFAHDQTGWA